MTSTMAQHQMPVVRHETIRKQLDGEDRQHLRQHLLKCQIIPGVLENVRPGVPAIQDVKHHLTGGDSGHGRQVNGCPVGRQE